MSVLDDGSWLFLVDERLGYAGDIKHVLCLIVREGWNSEPEQGVGVYSRRASAGYLGARGADCKFLRQNDVLRRTGKKKQTRRDLFLADIEAVTPWSDLVAVIEPPYPKGEGRSRRPISVLRMLRM